MKNLSRKEAMEILNGMKVKIEIPKAAVTQNKRNAALDMAINALNCSEFPNNSDTISRQALPYSIEPDGTLTVTVPKGTKRIGRILIEEDGTHYGRPFYPDEE